MGGEKSPISVSNLCNLFVVELIRGGGFWALCWWWSVLHQHCSSIHLLRAAASLAYQLKFNWAAPSSYTWRCCEDWDVVVGEAKLCDLLNLRQNADERLAHQRVSQHNDISQVNHQPHSSISGRRRLKYTPVQSTDSVPTSNYQTTDLHLQEVAVDRDSCLNTYLGFIGPHVTLTDWLWGMYPQETRQQPSSSCWCLSFGFHKIRGIAIEVAWTKSH